MTTAPTPERKVRVTPSGWVVTSRHRSSAAIKPARPYGTWHARRPGDAYTACGLPAADWPIFWLLSHVQGREDNCVECQEIMHAGRAE
jgi:hypothetical protein